MARRAFPGNAAGPTWLDWLPPGYVLPTDEELITRDELLRRMATNGVKIHPRTLEIMERQELVPRAVRQWHAGATRALYPAWMVHLALRVYDHRWARRRRPLTQTERQDAVKRAMNIPMVDALRPEYV